MHGVDLVVKMYSDEERVRKLAEKVGLHFEIIFNGKENKIVYWISNIVATFETLEGCEEWLIEEFEEK